MASFEMDGHAVAGADQDTIFWMHRSYPTQFIAFHEGNGDQTIGANTVKGRKGRFFDVALFGEHE